MRLELSFTYTEVTYLRVAQMFRNKYRSVLLASHYFRMALLGKPGWLEESESLPAYSGRLGRDSMDANHTNMFIGVGSTFQENFCYNDAACPPGQFGALPAFAKAEFDWTIAGAMVPNDSPSFASLMQRALTHSWWSLGFVFDPTLAPNGPGVMHYWMNFVGNINFPHREFHRPFMMAARAAKLFARLDKSRAANSAPAILDGNAVSMTVHRDTTNNADSVRLITNIMRCNLLRMRRELLAGSPVAARKELTEGGNISEWERRFTELAKTLADPRGSLAEMRSERDTFAAGAALATEVTGLIAKAREVPSTME